ncbi:hypothetical protein ACJMK2_031455 [Sinanodonta woodiana]|uniref:Cyclic nucleotide-binding domain-containing protein n=1 Tax=Sinanodonta woodiana TaxID=1069815 RepID=A0ABD3WYV2_SINWO
MIVKNNLTTLRKRLLICFVIHQGLPGTERKKALRNKFKRLIRKWNCVRILLKLSKVSTQQKEMNQTFRVVDNMGSVFTFDPSYSKKVITTYGKLSDRVRIIFRKDPKERTKADERILLEVINRLPLFSNFPSRVKQDLAQVMVFDIFEKGRIVIRQGDPGTRVYFLLSGQVFLIQTETDPKSGAKRTIHLKTLTGGSIFGELALIRSIRRDHTAVTSDDSEFLSLGKDDFEKVLKKRLLKDNTERYDFLRSSQHLQAFSDKQIQKCADSSELKTYCDNKVIIGDVETTENVYFIKKGRCKIVKRVYFVRHQSPYVRPVLFLHETPEQREKFLNKTYGRKMRWRRQEVHLLTIITLHPGDYFGAGENLQDMYVVARGKTECLLLNAVQFQIHSKMDVLRRLKSEREDVLPSDIELYRRFETNRKWLEYRQQLVQEVSGRKPGDTSPKYTYL